MGRMRELPPVPEKLHSRLEIAAAWEEKSIVDLLEDWSSHHFKTQILASLNFSKRRWSRVLQHLESQKLSQRQMARALGKPLGTIHRWLREEFREPRPKARGSGKPRAAK